MRRQPPPIVSCQECGKEMRTWARNPLCGKCIRDITEGRKKCETLRDFRKRLKGRQEEKP